MERRRFRVRAGSRGDSSAARRVRSSVVSVGSAEAAPGGARRPAARPVLGVNPAGRDAELLPVKGK